MGVLIVTVIALWLYRVNSVIACITFTSGPPLRTLRFATFDMGRRLALTSLLALLPADSQMLVALMLGFVGIIGTQKIKPHWSPLADSLQYACNWLIFGCMVSMMLMLRSPAHTTRAQVGSRIASVETRRTSEGAHRMCARLCHASP